MENKLYMPIKQGLLSKSDQHNIFLSNTPPLFRVKWPSLNSMLISPLSEIFTVLCNSLGCDLFSLYNELISETYFTSKEL